MTRPTFAGWLCAVLAVPAFALAAPLYAAALVESFDMSIPTTPTAVTIEGRSRLLYEVHLTNFSAADATPTHLRVIDDSDDTVIGDFNRAALSERMRIIGRSGAVSTVHPGERAVVYLELDSTRPFPRHLRHAIDFDAPSASGHTVEGAKAEVRTESSAPLGPPLRGGPWAAIHSPDWPRGHRRVFYTLGGRARLPGRFAVDWVRIDDDGRTKASKGDADLASNALGYGEKVLAVADAKVAAVRDNMAESERISANPRHSLDEAPGNYIVLALPDGRFVTYEHLRPGSLKVRVGEQVKRGQVIAELGFTGDSTGPHLHFHVADGTVPLASEGLPYRFDRFRLLGRYPRIAELGTKRWEPLDVTLGENRTGEFPPSNSVVMFPSP